MELFFKRVYTIAFRLTGEKEIAAEIATKAITNTINNINEDCNEESVFKSTIVELIKVFLNVPKLHCNDNLKGIQGALLKLKPIHRAVIVWKDILGFQINDNTPISEYTYDELLKLLVNGRQDIKRWYHS